MIVCMGDSITAGQYLGEGGNPWPEQIGAYNRGVNNDTTRLMLERFPADVQQSGADICIIQAGHNDCNRWQTDNGLPRVSERAFTANLHEMIIRCKTFKITPVLVNLTPTLKEGRYEDDAEDYSNAVEFVAQQWDMKAIDVRSAFIRFDIKDLLLHDKIHLSQAGHDLYAHTVRGAL